MITEKNFAAAAALLGCPIWTVRAVCKVESTGAGFYPGTNKVVIKFEGHVFQKYTGGKFDQSHPHLSYSKWTERYSKKGPEGAYERFNQAFKLNPKAAMLATSWGAFQIMGENYREAGYKTIDDFVTAMRSSEFAQLMAFCSYIKARKMEKYMKDLSLPSNAAAFALRYNGRDYDKHDYDGLLITANNYFKNLYLKKS